MKISELSKELGATSKELIALANGETELQAWTSVLRLCPTSTRTEKTPMF